MTDILAIADATLESLFSVNFYVHLGEIDSAMGGGGGG